MLTRLSYDEALNSCCSVCDADLPDLRRAVMTLTGRTCPAYAPSEPSLAPTMLLPASWWACKSSLMWME